MRSAQLQDTKAALRAFREFQRTNPFRLDDDDPDAIEFTVGKFTYAESKKITRIVERTGLDMAFTEDDLDRLEQLIFPKVTFVVPGATAGKMVLADKDNDNEELAFGGNPTYPSQVIIRAIAIELGHFLVGKP